MKQMSEQMNSMLAGGGMQQMGEDIEMLRQILDNLLLFSFDQEDLLNTFKSIQINHNEYAKNLIKQQNLREHFEHVDDSLFTLSLISTKNTEYKELDKKGNEFEQYEAKARLNLINKIYQSYDENANQKYKVEVNQRTIDRVKNSF